MILQALIEQKCRGLPQKILEWMDLLHDQKMILVEDDESFLSKHCSTGVECHH